MIFSTFKIGFSTNVVLFAVFSSDSLDPATTIFVKLPDCVDLNIAMNSAVSLMSNAFESLNTPLSFVQVPLIF